MAAHMSAQEKLNPKTVTAARKNEVCIAAGTSPAMYNQMAGMHMEARAAFKSWCAAHSSCATYCLTSSRYSMASKNKASAIAEGAPGSNTPAAGAKGQKIGKRGHL